MGLKRKGWGLAAASIVTPSLFPHPATAAQLEAVWLGGTNNWSCGSCWSNGQAPNNSGETTYLVLIDGGRDGTPSAVALDMLATIDGLTTDADDALTINNGRELRMYAYDGTSLISNAGSIFLDSSGSNTYLRFDPRDDGDVFTLAGGGEVVATGTGPNWIEEIYGQAILHNLDNTIHGGSLNIGSNNLQIVNGGLVWSDAGGTIFIDPQEGAFGMTNTGAMRAHGGTLRLYGGDYDNSAGVIEALDGSVVELWNGASIHGGTLRGMNGGQIQAASGAPTLALHTGFTPTLEGTLRILNGRELRTYGQGTIHNTGAILLDSQGSNTYFRFDPDADGETVTLSGGGEIVATGTGPNWIEEVYGNAVLHNVDHTIRGGSLNIGSNNLQLVNDGLVWSDIGGTITIDPQDGDSGMTNTGALRAQGGTLRLQGGNYDNRAGVIEALDGSFVELWSGAAVQGGTLRGENGGEIQTASGAPTLILSTAFTPTLEGALRIINGNELRTYGQGTINNTGTILLDAHGSNTYFRFDPEVDGDTVTLIGGGEIVASDTGPNWITEVYGNAVLVNQDNTIRGGNLNIGYNSLRIVNHALIVADAAHPVVLDPEEGWPAGFVNTGFLRAENAAVLRLIGGEYANDGGVIEALEGSTVELGSSAAVHGGTIRSVGAGEVLVVGTAVLNLQTGSAPTLEGTLRIANGAELRTYGQGVVNNAGTILLDTQGSNTYLRFDPSVDGDTVTLTGGGQIIARDTGPNWITEVYGDAVLVNQDNTIRGGRVNIGYNSLPFINQGAVIADSDTFPIVVDPPDGSTGFDNQGTIQALGAAGMTLSAGPFTTSGEVRIAANSQVSRSGAYTQTSGSTAVDGTLSATQGLDIQGGELKGNGLVSPTTNRAGFVKPGTSAGKLSINGDFTQQAEGSLDMEIAGREAETQHDVLSVAGTATFAGTLNLVLLDGFLPEPGDALELIAYAAYAGRFAAVAGQDLGNGSFLVVSYQRRSLNVHVGECIDFADFKARGKLGMIRFKMNSGLPEGEAVTVTATDANTGDSFSKKKRTKLGLIKSAIKALPSGSYDVCVTKTPNCGRGCFESQNVDVP